MIEIEIIVSDEVSGMLTVESDKVRNYVCAIIESSGFSDAEINIVFIGDEQMIELNETYKKRSGTTDVLSFTLSEKGDEKLEGEVYISLEKAQKQCSQFLSPFEEEVVRLVTHGVLHLTGRTHDSEEELKDMINETERLVRSFFNSGGTK
ncbi:MAG: rRNA maturation RNase YbeY [Candidatus Latescibacteria bacterium]|nr:rRNA maturation RNase YbeY [Candidatus Latescibacterota bacterium]